MHGLPAGWPIGLLLLPPGGTNGGGLGVAEQNELTAGSDGEVVMGSVINVVDHRSDQAWVRVLLLLAAAAALSAVLALAAELWLAPVVPENVRAVFDRVDRNGDGCLTRAELSRALRKDVSLQVI